MHSHVSRRRVCETPSKKWNRIGSATIDAKYIDDETEENSFHFPTRRLPAKPSTVIHRIHLFRLLHTAAQMRSPAFRPLSLSRALSAKESATQLQCTISNALTMICDKHMVLLGKRRAKKYVNKWEETNKCVCWCARARAKYVCTA